MDEAHDVAAALREAHVRIRAILDAALRVSREGADVVEAARVASAICELLTLSFPMHELHEEQTIFPALRAYGPKDAVDAALAFLVDEHMDFDALSERVVQGWTEVAQNGASLEPLRADLLVLTETLARAITEHAEHEERVVLPLVREWIPADVQGKMLEVMAHRSAER